MPHSPDLRPIRKLIRRRTTVPPDSVHGPTHWARVEANGVKIARAIEADELVAVLFALFHDSMRLNDGHDPDHGPRAAAFARSEDQALSFLSGEQLEQLCHACEWHTHELHHADPTIGACYDADRLDLGRVGIRPDPRYLNSKFARNLCWELDGGRRPR